MRILDLVVQAAQDVFGGFGVVVLHEFTLEAGGLLEGPGVEAFEEEAAVVAEDLGFEDDDFGDGGGCRLHQNTFSLSRPSRYWP